MRRPAGSIIIIEQGIPNKGVSSNCASKAGAGTAQTPQEVLKKWAIMRTGVLMTPTAVKGMVSAVLSGVPGAQVAHVLKARDPEDAPNDLERETVRRSCQALLQVRCSLAV